MSGKSWLVIDADGAVVNRVVWNGVTEWAPPEGPTVVRESPAAPEVNAKGVAK